MPADALDAHLCASTSFVLCVCARLYCCRRDIPAAPGLTPGGRNVPKGRGSGLTAAAAVATAVAVAAVRALASREKRVKGSDGSSGSAGRIPCSSAGAASCMLLSRCQPLPAAAASAAAGVTASAPAPAAAPPLAPAVTASDFGGCCCCPLLSWGDASAQAGSGGDDAPPVPSACGSAAAAGAGAGTLAVGAGAGTFAAAAAAIDPRWLLSARNCEKAPAAPVAGLPPLRFRSGPCNTDMSHARASVTSAHVEKTARSSRRRHAAAVLSTGILHRYLKIKYSSHNCLLQISN